MSKKLLLIFIAFCLIPFSAFAQNKKRTYSMKNVDFANIFNEEARKERVYGKTVDVSKFEVSGIRLGMTFEEVREQLKARGYTHAEWGNSWNSFDFKLLSTAKTFDGKPASPVLMFEEGERVEILFVPDIIDGKIGPLVVAKVMYEYHTNNKYDSVQLAKAAIEKYGKPTVFYRPDLLESGFHSKLQWCPRLDQRGVDCENQVMLTQQFRKLILETSIYEEKFKTFKDQELRNAATKPAL